MLFKTPFEAICKFFCTVKTKNYGVPTNKSEIDTGGKENRGVDAGKETLHKFDTGGIDSTSSRRYSDSSGIPEQKSP